MKISEADGGPASAFESPTFGRNGSFDLDKPVGSASISPCGRDVVLASRQGLHIIDLDSPYSPPRHLPHHTPWEVADVQWSPFAARDYWVVSTSNQKALVWNLAANSRSSVEHVLHAHTRAITDINFSAHNPDVLATCAVDSFVHCWDLRHPHRPAMTFCDWFAAATQVKWNRQDSHIIASSHDTCLRIWDDRKGAYPLKSIEAHATKIYGVDWSRTEISCLVTCSLDCTIKFWDYTKGEAKPSQVIHTAFPVWRARHTPFGFGVLALPQRGDYDLHLYDHRNHKNDSQLQDERSTVVHRFGGHHDQVKEFLWRPRGTITESRDERDFQLVSWGTDRMLRLHEVNGEVLSRVGYEKGAEIKRRMNFTRRDAVYKTFREDPANNPLKNPEDVPIVSNVHEKDSAMETRSALTAGISRAPIPFFGGYGTGGLMTPIAGRQSASAKDMDPISWMRGVKIGKREASPLGLDQSVSSVLSPNLKTDPTWDVFDSLGEEISHVGDKFTKVSFDEIDMQSRVIVVSLTGPWGFNQSISRIKARIVFPQLYPNDAEAKVSLDKIAVMGEDTFEKINSELTEIASRFQSHQKSSLEAILRYLLGEQNLEDILLWLKKRGQSVDLDSTADAGFSSSDEDDEVLGRYSVSKLNDMESSDLMTVKSRAQNNPPLPKACGALWAENGLLVCFFPHKPEKAPSLLDLSLKANERSSKTKRSVFEGFGRFDNRMKRKRQATSTLETIESGDSSYEDLSALSSESSSPSDGIELSRHHFLPNVAGQGDASEILPGVTLDESQKSSGGMEKSRLRSSKEKNFISIQDHAYLLPSSKFLAQNYVLAKDSRACAHNASIAQEAGHTDLANAWKLIELLLQGQIPPILQNNECNPDNAEVIPLLDSGAVAARHISTKLKCRDSAIDLSFDGSEEKSLLSAQVPVKWGKHPFARRYLVDAFFRYYEQVADIQMLAMLSYVFSEHQKPKSVSPKGNGTSHQVYSSNLGDNDRSSMQNYRSLRRIASSVRNESISTSSAQQDIYNLSDELESFAGAPLSDLSSSTTPPSDDRSLRSTLKREDSRTASLSTSLEHARQGNRSSLNLSLLSTAAPRPLRLGFAITSSSPTPNHRTHLSPAGSYIGASTSTNGWSPPQYFGRSSSSATENSKHGLTLSISDAEEDTSTPSKKPVFTTKLKNQGKFQNERYTNDVWLDPQQDWHYYAYREAYAHMLYVWDLPMTRAEMLKRCGKSSLHPTSSDQGPISHPIFDTAQNQLGGVVYDAHMR
ncbi:hypothetical protein ACLMJK_001032 [Lecanora helva]